MDTMLPWWFNQSLFLDADSETHFFWKNFQQIENPIPLFKKKDVEKDFVFVRALWEFVVHCVSPNYLSKKQCQVQKFPPQVSSHSSPSSSLKWRNPESSPMISCMDTAYTVYVRENPNPPKSPGNYNISKWGCLVVISLVLGWGDSEKSLPRGWIPQNVVEREGFSAKW